MKTTTLAAATFALSAALIVNQDVAFAKGPLLEIEGSSPLILVKETPTKLDMKDFPFGLEEGTSNNVQMEFSQEIKIPEEDDALAVMYTITLPTLDVEKDGDDKVTITFPSEYSVVMNMDVDGEGVQLDMDGIAEDQVMTFVRDGDRMSYTGTAKSFGVTMTSPQAAEEGVDFKVTMGGEGLDIEGAGAAEQDWTDMKSLDLSYDYTMDAMTFAGSVTGEGAGGEEFDMTGESGAVAARGLIGGGRVEGGSQMNDFKMNIMKPMPIEISVGKLATEIGMPTEPSPKPQDIKYLISAEDIKIDDMLWAMMDPQEAFPRDLNKLVIDLEMQAMMMISLLDPASIAEAEASGMPPMLPTSMKINSISFDGMGLEVDATGEGELKGAQPDGKAYVTIKGLKDFVASAQKAGMFGEQEAMMVEGMAGQLGKEGDDGELIFDIKTEGAMVNINGAPVMPIPGMQ